MLERAPLHPSGAAFSHGRCEVYTWTRSRGDAGWLVIGQYLNGQVALAAVDASEPLAGPVRDAVDQLVAGPRREPFRAVLLRADDDAQAVLKALDYFARVDHHVYEV